MGTSVKICGVTTDEAADAAVAAGADFMGLVFFPASPRRLSPARAAALADRARGRIRLVAVVVDASDDAIAAAVAAARPDFLQLHGREEPARVAAIRSTFGLPVIKALHIAEAADLARAPAYEAVADMLMFDAKAPAEADRPGGHGAAFDWRMLKGRTFARPWLLAGGLDVHNVARAIETAGAPGVDVSSAVESAPGIKDARMIADFVAAARAPQTESQA